MGEKGIIYKVTNSSTGMVYIGKTTTSLELRQKQHLFDASHGSPFYFHRALCKYGFDVFCWEIVDEGKSKSELDDKEQYWIKFYKSFYPLGYNLTYGGEGGKLTQYVREKISKAQLGRQVSTETRQKISNAMQGCTGSMKGKQFTDEHKQKIRAAMQGRTFSAEHRKKLSDAKRGTHPRRIQVG